MSESDQPSLASGSTPERMLAEVVAGTVIFRILVRRDAALDEAWVDEMTELIAGRWSSCDAQARWSSTCDDTV